MDKVIINEESWITNEIKDSDLGDKRLDNRLGSCKLHAIEKYYY